MEGSSKVKMPSKTRLATGKVVESLKGARQERLQEEVRELRAKCEKLEKDYKDIKKKYNQIRMAQAPATRVVKASTVATNLARPKSANKAKAKSPALPEIKGAEQPPAPAEDTGLLHQEIAELKRQLTDSEDARRIEKENAQWELQAKNEKVTALEAEVRSLMLMVQRAQSQPQSQPGGGNSAELEALRRKLRESEQAAAACAHVARTADIARKDHDTLVAKMKAQMREVKLRLCKYELECTCGVGDGAEAQPRRAAREEPEDDAEGLGGAPRIAIVMRNGRWGPPGANASPARAMQGLPGFDLGR